MERQKPQIGKNTKSIWPVTQESMERIGETLADWKQRINTRINLLRNLRSFDDDPFIEGDLIVNGNEKKLNESIDREGNHIRVWGKQKERSSIKGE